MLQIRKIFKLQIEIYSKNLYPVQDTYTRVWQIYIDASLLLQGILDKGSSAKSAIIGEKQYVSLIRIIAFVGKM